MPTDFDWMGEALCEADKALRKMKCGRGGSGLSG